MKCDYVSVWDVMLYSDSNDFGNKVPLPDDTDTVPVFRIVQPWENMRVVLVIDVSSSMRIVRMYTLLYQ